MSTKSNENITIARSFSRKLNLGNYETVDFFSSRSIELPIETSLEEQLKISEEQFVLAMNDVVRDIKTFLKTKDGKEGKISIEKLVLMCNSIAEGKPIMIEDFEKLNPTEHTLIQAVKRAYKRSPAYKSTQVIKGNHEG